MQVYIRVKEKEWKSKGKNPQAVLKVRCWKVFLVLIITIKITVVIIKVIIITVTIILHSWVKKKKADIKKTLGGGRKKA